MSELDIDMEVISRWEPTGLVDGLPIWEKEELSILFDNTIRIILSNTTIKALPKDVFTLLEETSMPIIRRLYRRVGGSFNLDNMLSLLLGKIEENKTFLNGDVTPLSNPVVEFAVEFADNYEDEITSTKQLTKEEYSEQVDKMLKYLREVLLNDNMVTNVDKTDEDWFIKLSDKKKSNQATRFWNQRVGKELFTFSLSDINKGKK